MSIEMRKHSENGKWATTTTKNSSRENGDDDDDDDNWVNAAVRQSSEWMFRWIVAKCMCWIWTELTSVCIVCVSVYDMTELPTG